MAKTVLCIQRRDCIQKNAQNVLSPHLSCPAPSSLCISVGTRTHAGKFEPTGPPKCFCPTSWGPLLDPYCPNCPSSTTAPAHIKAPDIGLYWLVWDRPPQGSLLILAALPPSQEDNLLWLPSISHLLALSLFLTLSVLSISTPLHSVVAWPTPPYTHTHTHTPSIPSFAFSHSLFSSFFFFFFFFVWE